MRTGQRWEECTAGERGYVPGMEGPPIHPDIEPLAFLLGTWVGDGRGEYPTIDSFSYREEIRVTHVGKPFLAYTQRTWDPATARPLHSETGYWRLTGDGDIELVLAHPSGVVEIEEGTLRGRAIELRSTSVLLSSTAKPITELARTILVGRDILDYEVKMGAMGLPLQFHLAAELTRQDSDLLQ